MHHNRTIKNVNKHIPNNIFGYPNATRVTWINRTTSK